MPTNGSARRTGVMIALGVTSLAVGIALFVIVVVALRARTSDIAFVRAVVETASAERKEMETEMRVIMREFGSIKADIQQLKTIIGKRP